MYCTLRSCKSLALNTGMPVDPKIPFGPLQGHLDLFPLRKVVGAERNRAKQSTGQATLSFGVRYPTSIQLVCDFAVCLKRRLRRLGFDQGTWQAAASVKWACGKRQEQERHDAGFCLSRILPFACLSTNGGKLNVVTVLEKVRNER